MTGNATAIVTWLMKDQRDHPDRVYECKERKRRRSLDANGYYWSILTKLADKLSLSKTRIHNMMLRSYGQPELIGGQLARIPIPDTEEAELKVLEAETYHMKPTSHVRQGKDGIMYRTYYLMRGSSSYDSREFSVLLEGLITEAKEQGIETLPPAELEKMYTEMKAREEKHEKVDRDKV